MSLGKADGNYQRMEKQQKAMKKEESSDEELESLEEEEKRQKGVVGSVGFGNNGKKGGSTAGNGMRCCQAEKCTADLSDAKPYHRRHKVCEQHAKAQVVLVGGIRQRFCQQCSRFGGFFFLFICDEFHGVLSLLLLLLNSFMGGIIHNCCSIGSLLFNCVGI